jgi:TolB-like protein/DNA-binding winged helix-turn-helix (wHTH) protein/Tfp pilus assembly protein PilF
VLRSIPHPNSTYTFGPYRVDFESYEILKHGIRLRIQNQPVRILRMLIERPGQLVTRQEVQEELWPGLSAVETDDNLNSSMKKLREALGDDAAKPLYIETVPRKGYRFVAPVQVETPVGPVADKPVAESSEEKPRASYVDTPGAARTKGYSWKILVASLVVVAGCLVAGFLLPRYFRHAEAATVHSIAVLPFENLSGDASQDYFAEGLTDAVTTDLAQIGTVKVISRASASHYRTNSSPLKQIREDLGVDAVVEGTLSHSGGLVRVNARLVATGDERNLWAQSFVRDAGDILSLQDDLAESVADRIQATISPEMRARFNEAHTVNVAAYQAYLNGMHDLNYHRRNNELRQSLEEFDRAITLDPKLAAAYAGKAYTYSLLGDYDAMTGAQAGPKAIAAARQALALDPSLASAHAALAFSLWKYEWNWKEADAEFRRALELNPNNAHTHHGYGVYLACAGDFAGADEHMQKALALDPLSMIIRTNIGWVDYFRGNYAKAEKEYQDVLKLDPGFVPARQKLWITYAVEGKRQEAANELENVMRLFGNNELLAKVEKAKPADRYETALRNYVAAGILSRYEQARYLALLGNQHGTMEALKEAAGERSAWIVYIRIEPVFAPMRKSAEFAELEKRANFPEESGAARQ